MEFPVFQVVPTARSRAHQDRRHRCACADLTAFMGWVLPCRQTCSWVCLNSVLIVKSWIWTINLCYLLRGAEAVLYMHFLFKWAWPHNSSPNIWLSYEKDSRDVGKQSRKCWLGIPAALSWGLQGATRTHCEKYFEVYLYTVLFYINFFQQYQSSEGCKLVIISSCTLMYLMFSIRPTTLS